MQWGDSAGWWGSAFLVGAALGLASLAVWKGRKAAPVAVSPRKHCFCTIVGGVSISTGNESKVEVRCCYCDVPTRRTSVRVVLPIPGHGPYATAETWEDRGTPLDAELCPGPPREWAD